MEALIGLVLAVVPVSMGLAAFYLIATRDRA